MNGSQTRGLAALANSISSTKSSDKDFQASQMLNQEVEKQKLQQEQAQIQEQQYYEQINEKAKNLLSHDREKINQKSLQLQNSVKDKIKMYGGDRKLFLQNGGYKMLKSYERDLTNSNEFLTYENNAKNLARIIDAQSKGFGHLLLEKDINSMQDYDKNKGGVISYSGMMQDVEIPDARNYDLGKDIPVTDILNHNENYIKILSNFRMYYPDIPEEEITPQSLMAFATKMGYGGKGSNRDALNFRRKLALSRASKSSKTQKSPKGDNSKIKLTTKIVRTLQEFPSNKTVKQLFEENPQMNYFQDQANSGNTFIKAFTSSTPWNFISRKANLNEDGDFLNFNTDPNEGDGAVARGIKNFANWAGHDKYKVANAARVFEGSEKTIIDRVLGAEIKNGTVTIEPDESFFRMDGVQLQGDNKLEPGKYKKEYKVLGLTTGTFTKNSDGIPQILMTVHDDDGELDEKGTKKFVDGLQDNTAQAGVFAAFEDENNRIFYKRIEIEDPGVQNVLSQALGDEDNLNEVLKSQQAESKSQQIGQKAADQVDQNFANQLLSIDKSLDTNEGFKLESFDYSDPTNRELNRSSLMKTFYITMANMMNSDVNQLASGRMFDQAVKLAGEDSINLFKDFSGTLTDEELVERWYIEASKDLDPEEEKEAIQRNAQIAQQWLEMLKKYKRINDL